MDFHFASYAVRLEVGTEVVEQAAPLAHCLSFLEVNNVKRI